MIKLERCIWATILVLLLSISSMDYAHAVPANNFKDRANHTLNNDLIRLADRQFPNIDYLHKFGRNPDIDTASGFEAIWNGGGDYTGFNATVAETLEVFSSVAQDAGTLLSSGTATATSFTQLIDSGATFVTDTVAIGDIILDDTHFAHGIVTEVTSETVLTVLRFDEGGGSFEGAMHVGDVYRVATPASTGVAVVHLQNLLDVNLSNETEEFVIMNGTTGVDTVGTYMRNSRHTAIQAGSNGSNVGTITTRQKTTTANIMGVMPIGYNQSMIAAYTVPLDKDAHIMSWYVSLSGKTQANCNVRILIRHINEIFAVHEEVSISGAGSSSIVRSYTIPKNEIAPGTDIKIMADTDTNETGIAAGFDLVTLSNE